MYVVRTISVLDKFDKQSVIQSLRNMDQTRSNLSGTSSAFAASSAPPRSRSKAPYKPQSTSSTSSTSNSSSSAPGRPICEFCTTPGHVEAKCFLKQHLLHRINPPSSPTASPASTSPQAPSDTPQSTSAASASALSSSSFQHDSHTSWNADTGASAHMTCHRHWMRNLKPHRLQIRLADGSVVYSEGVGLVHFNPVVNGQEMAPLEFTNVLYVPALCSNLFSVLFLTLHRHFTVCIEQDTMHFIRDNKVAFQAKTGASNSAFLVGETIPVEEFASLSSATTLPLDWDLWHRHLCHHHLAGIRKLQSGNLVTGFKLDSQADPDPVCEACKAGKMHADPFPPSSSRASKPLQLVHSDVHGPVKVSTHQGYRYWVTFIDDFSCFKAVSLPPEAKI